MRSHEYKLTLRDLGRILLSPLLILCALAGLLRLSRHFDVLPHPAAAWDPNTTILMHQSRAARSRGHAEIVLIGDSTCLVGVNPLVLSHELANQLEIVNLAMLSWFDLRDYAELAAEFAQTNPGRVRTIVLLVTPEKLGMSRSEGQEEFWREIHSNSNTTSTSGKPPDLLAARCLRENLLSHVLGVPLRQRGLGTAYFGFSSEVDSYMTAHHGSLLDFSAFLRPKSPPGANWKFAPDLESQSCGFRAQIPHGTRLLVGFTPVARSFFTPGDDVHRREALERWNQWLGADVILTNLPACLPDVLFASKGHLNQVGQARFTQILARNLAPLLGPSKETERSTETISEHGASRIREEGRVSSR